MRAAAYIRESTEEQANGFSPEAQRNTIYKFAEDNNLKIVKEYVDYETGRKAEKRPGFQKLISDAIKKEFDVILVFHTSRFARNTMEAKHYKKMLREKLGIDVISVTQRFGDYQDPSAFLNESINEIFDEYYSVNLSFWTRMGLKEKAQQGFLNGSVPFGYCRKEKGAKEVVPHPKQAPIVVELFKKYATGEYSDRELAIWLNSKGFKTNKGRPFNKDSVRHILTNDVYCGFVSGKRSRGPKIPGKHEPIVDIELFERVQRVRKEKALMKNPPPHYRVYLLSGILYCGYCGAKMHGNPQREGRCYYCYRRKVGNSCLHRLNDAEILESQLVNFLCDFHLPEDVIQKITSRLKERVKSKLSQEQEENFNSILKKLERLKDLYIMGDLPKNEYLYRKQVLENELASYRPVKSTDIKKAIQILSDFKKFWQGERDQRERQKLLNLLLNKVIAKDNKIVAVQPKRSFLPFFKQLADIGGADGI